MRNKVLVLDDENNIVDILKFHLEKNGYEAISANNGTDGAQLALDDDPDLILLDITMPEIDGFEYCSILKKNVKTKPCFINPI